MACENCPDAVIATLRRKVQAELDKLRSVLQLVEFFNAAFGAVAGTAVGDVDSAVDSIPDPVSLGYLDIIKYVTCPLTPLALGIDGIANLLDFDPDTQLAKIRDLGSGDIDTARSNYERFLSNSVNAKLIRQARKFERDLRRIQFDADSFAEALVISASILAVCGQEEFAFGPFQAFATTANNFSFVGGVPSTLDQNLAALIQRLATGEAKFKALREQLN